jgi:hypothetical protein
MVEFPNIKIRDKMFDFLCDNLQPFNKLLAEDIEYVRGPVKDPSYYRRSAGDRLIGFDFSLSGDMQSRIAQLVCYWMLKRVSGTKFWYDGDETWSIPEECDEYGFHSLARIEEGMLARNPSFTRKLFYKPMIRSYSRFNKPVYNELKRLTELWNKI